MSFSEVKPSVLLVSKFYRRGGGDCIHLLALERLLREKGHRVGVFTMHHADNLPLPADSFEACEVSISGGIASRLRAARRILGGAGVREDFMRALRQFKPDIVHLHNIHSYISPAVAQEAHRFGAKVIWTLHDYKLLCPSYSFLRNGTVCEDCMTDPLAVIRTRCMKGSAAASVLAYAEARKWNRKMLEECTDAFVCPSQFMKAMMERGGFDKSKLKVINNFLSYTPAELSSHERSGMCYVGRLSPEKGVEYLLEAASKAQWQLTVAGSGPSERELKEKYGGYNNIRFVGMLGATEVQSLLASSRLSVVPSVWYENYPLAAIESLCAGTPVAASRIGGIPEIVTPGNGILFEPRSAESIAKAVDSMLASDIDHNSIAADARERFSPHTYYNIYASMLAALNGK